VVFVDLCYKLLFTLLYSISKRVEFGLSVDLCARETDVNSDSCDKIWLQFSNAAVCCAAPITRACQRRRGLKHVDGAESCNFPKAAANFYVTEEIMDAHNFNFAPEFSKVGHFEQQILFLEKKFLQFPRRYFFLDGRRESPSAATHCSDATGVCHCSVL